MLIIALIALTARLIVVFNSNPIVLGNDEIDYYMLAKNLYEKKGFVVHEKSLTQFQGGKPGEPTAFRTIILPAFIAAHFYVFGEDLLMPRLTLVLLSALCCIFIGLMGKTVYNKETGILAALIWALYPTAIFSWYSSDRILSEGIGIFFIVVSYYYLIKLFRQYSLKAIILSSVFFSLAILSRGYLALTVPLIIGYLFFFANQKRFLTAFLYGLFVSLSLGIWVVRNYVVMGKPVLSTQTDSFYWGNNAWTRGSMHGDVFLMPPWTAPQVLDLVKKYPDIRNFSEIQLSEVWPREGFAYLKEHPRRAVWLWGRKLIIYVLPLQIWGYGFYKLHYVYLLLLIATIFAFWRVKDRKEYFLLLLPFFGVWISTLLTFAMDRYRYSIEPFIIILGSFGLIELFSYLKQRVLRRNGVE